MNIEQLTENNEGGLFDKFDEWRAKQSPEQLKEFYVRLDKINNSKREFLELQCKRMNKDAVGGKFVVVEKEENLYIEWREKI